MRKLIFILITLLLTCVLDTSAQYSRVDFNEGENGYVILKDKDGTPTDEVRLVGPEWEGVSEYKYRGEEDVPDVVTHNGKTYKVVEFGYFYDSYRFLKCLKFGRNMRKVNINNMNNSFFLESGFEVSEENKHLKAIDNILYTADGKKLLNCATGFNPANLYYPLSTSNVITIPDDVEIIGPQAFSNSYNIIITKLPKALKEIGEEAFCYFRNMPEELEIPEGVTKIGPEAFCATSIRKLTLPSTLEEFGSLGTMLKLDSLICMAPTPPTATASYISPEDNYPRWFEWYDYYQNAVLIVPQGSEELYRQHREWGLFKNIVGMSPTGIVSLTDDHKKDDKIYRLDGTPVLNPKSGIYIKNGKKMMIR